jgi:NAD(P)-dependent dehydrogenase (short-subunit alcohol dehydrogenase family)
MGFHIAQGLALKGAKVYVSARSLEKAESAIKYMKENNPSLASSGLLHPLALELSDLQNIGAVARDFASKEKRLNILVNNAAL